MIPRKDIIFLDTNILSDIGRFSYEYIKTIVEQICLELQLVVAVTPFNIMEIERIPDEYLKEKIHWFLDKVVVVFFKSMPDLFVCEVQHYNISSYFNPIQFVTTLISEHNNQSTNYVAIMNNLRNNDEYKRTVEEHTKLISKIQIKGEKKLNIGLNDFIMMNAHSSSILRDFKIAYTLEELKRYCPAFVSYCCSFYDKIGSKGLRRKAEEMNDNAMSYIFPYVGYIATEKRQAALYSSIRDKGIIPAMKDTVILKHSDLFPDIRIEKFALKEAIDSMKSAK